MVERSGRSVHEDGMDFPWIRNALKRQDFRERMIVADRLLELRFRSHLGTLQTWEHRRAWTYLERLASAPDAGAVVEMTTEEFAQRRGPMIQTIHIGHLLRETVASPYRNLVTRPTGAAIRSRIQQARAFQHTSRVRKPHWIPVGLNFARGWPT